MIPAGIPPERIRIRVCRSFNSLDEVGEVGFVNAANLISVLLT